MSTSSLSFPSRTLLRSWRRRSLRELDVERLRTISGIGLPTCSKALPCPSKHARKELSFLQHWHREHRRLQGLMILWKASLAMLRKTIGTVSYTHLRAHETR